MSILIAKLTYLICSASTAIVSWRLTRSWTFPPFVYSSVWFFSVAIIFLMGDYFYQLSLASLLFYTFGIIFFFLGGLAIIVSKPKVVKAPFAEFQVRHRDTTVYYLKLLVIVTSAFVPFYWSYISGLAGSTSLVEIRYFFVNESPSQSISFYANIPIVASLCFTGCLLELENDKFSKIFTFMSGISSILMLSMSGSKMGLVTIVMMWVICSVTISNKMNLRLIFIAFLVVLVGFVGGVWLINLRGTSEGVELLGILKIVVSYFLGGIVAFDQVLNDPDMYTSNQTMTRFFIETYAKLGGDVDVPSIHAQYTNINDLENTNTYTHFYTYFLDISVIGSLVTVFLLGVGTSYFWSHVSYNRPVVFFMHVGLVMAIIFTIYSEKILLGLNQAIKTVMYALVLYYFVPLIHINLKMLFKSHHRKGSGA